MKEKLDITSLIKACKSYVTALDYTQEVESQDFPKLYEKEMVSNALIHHFEIAYDLSWKMMKRFIEMNDRNIKILSRRDLFRIAGEKELIFDFDMCVEFHNARNKTSHTYDEETAEEVYLLAKEFKPYITNLISILNERINN